MPFTNFLNAIAYILSVVFFFSVYSKLCSSAQLIKIWNAWSVNNLQILLCYALFTLWCNILNFNAPLPSLQDHYHDPRQTSFKEAAITVLSRMLMPHYLPTSAPSGLCANHDELFLINTHSSYLRETGFERANKAPRSHYPSFDVNDIRLPFLSLKY